ncbi:outer membrane transport energization protein TonB [Bryocella elongata]|uniref:Outer membrane transport energization protein TonB n=1 Tax=Bryocella elongata TaxID=863522 RepID=A0A1H6B7U0_9BACT|nr:energy transducer TonB [Bryocella elongata]SEG56909.1 outer membrane transport energization protein TonB [Bryocella elongata]
MFEQSLVESTAMLRTRSRKPVYTAIAVQASLAAALLSIPILHPEVLPLHAPQMTLTAPALPKPTPPPPHVRMQQAAPSAGPTAPTAAPQSRISNFIRNLTSSPVDASPLLPTTGTVMAATSGPAVWASSPAGSSVSVRPAPAARSDRIAISGGVIAGMLLAPIVPVYPSIAKATRTEGTVVIEAVISTSGRIESAHAISGPAILQAAALEAVRSARYKPYLLNGAPTEVQTTITVNFRMGS